MNPWPFVMAAYAVALGLSFGLVLWSWTGMRRAEAAADELTRK